MKEESIRHCSRFYWEQYRFIKIRSITYEKSDGLGIKKPLEGDFSIVVKNIGIPSPDEIPLLHAMGLVADDLTGNGLRVSLYEYEPVGRTVDRAEELRRLIVYLKDKGVPSLIIIPRLLSTVIASLQEEHGITVQRVAAVNVVRDLVFYLPKTFVPLVRFLVKRNSMASYRKYELMKEHALSLGLRVTKEKFFGGNGEMLHYLANSAREGGVTELLKNIPVTRLNLTVMAVLRCLGKNELIRRENIEAGESETFLVLGLDIGDPVVDMLARRMEDAFSLYTGSNAYPSPLKPNKIVGKIRSGLENMTLKEIAMLYEASVEPVL